MKKLLVLFVILDFVFIGVILKLFNEKERSIASFEDSPKLTEGQNQKLDLIKSLKFSFSKDEVLLQTDYLQSLCGSYQIVELKFKAVNVAFSGQAPLISHSFSCTKIGKNPDQEILRTAIADLRSLQRESVLSKNESQLRAFGIFADEELPNDWVLFEIAVSGTINFTISEVELNEILPSENFQFSLTTF